MCGIAAIQLYPQERTPSDWLAIRDFFTCNLVFNEERGRAATGLAVLQTDGQVDMLKKPIPAAAFVKTPEYVKLLTRVSQQTTLILGHTRMPTKGSPICNDNNHPVQAGPVFGVHNGHIANDDDLFQRLDLLRQGQVDSEIIFRILATISPTPLNGGYLAAIQPLMQLLQGQFTFLACDQRQPAKLLVLQHENPLCIHFHARWNALIFSSRYIFLRRAFGHSLAAEALDRDKLMWFDAYTIPQRGIQPVAALALYGRNCSSGGGLHEV